MEYLIQTKQRGVHQDLIAVVNKHANSEFKRPVPEKQRHIFEQLDQLVKQTNKPIILDSGCGTGDSSAYFAEQYPDHLVVALDRSEARLHTAERKHQYDNLVFARMNLEDAWRLILQANWDIEKHFILYPNPYPKVGDLKKRFHGHPIFPVLLQLSPYLALRSNWKIYLDEFLLAAKTIIDVDTEVEQYYPTQAITAFEAKYQAVKESVFSLSLTKCTTSVTLLKR